MNSQNAFCKRMKRVIWNADTLRFLWTFSPVQLDTGHLVLSFCSNEAPCFNYVRTWPFAYLAFVIWFYLNGNNYLFLCPFCTLELCTLFCLYAVDFCLVTMTTAVKTIQFGWSVKHIIQFHQANHAQLFWIFLLFKRYVIPLVHLLSVICFTDVSVVGEMTPAVMADYSRMLLLLNSIVIHPLIKLSIDWLLFRNVPWGLLWFTF